MPGCRGRSEPAYAAQSGKSLRATSRITRFFCSGEPLLESGFWPATLSNFRVPHCHENYRVVYTDDLLAVEKPPGLLSVPGRHPDNRDCLITRVQADFPGALIVHRLDMATSGLMLLALNAETHRTLSRQFEHRLISKRYVAVVAGETAQAGSIGVPLMCDWPQRPKQKVDWREGKHALTHFQRLSFERGDSTVLLEPVTGRSHQLRLHLAHIGHPILGCEFYAPAAVRARSPRLQLHAAQLAFRHPSDGRPLYLESPAPFCSIPLQPLPDYSRD